MAKLHVLRRDDVRPIICLRGPATELRRLPGCAQITEDQVAGRPGWSASKLSRIENAHSVLLLSSPQPHSEGMASIFPAGYGKANSTVLQVALSARPSMRDSRRPQYAQEARGRTRTSDGNCHLEAEVRRAYSMLSSTNGPATPGTPAGPSRPTRFVQGDAWRRR
jgi:hypothetical protein